MRNLLPVSFYFHVAGYSSIFDDWLLLYVRLPTPIVIVSRYFNQALGLRAIRALVHLGYR